MSDDYKVQVSYKLGTNQAGMLNFRGNNVAEVDTLIGEARELLLPSVLGFEEDAKALGVIVTNFPQTTGGSEERGQRNAQPGNGGAPACVHGARVYREGDGWKGWFCPARREDPTKCKPQYDR